MHQRSGQWLIVITSWAQKMSGIFDEVEALPGVKGLSFVDNRTWWAEEG